MARYTGRTEMLGIPNVGQHVMRCGIMTRVMPCRLYWCRALPQLVYPAFLSSLDEFFCKCISAA